MVPRLPRRPLGRTRAAALAAAGGCAVLVTALGPAPVRAHDHRPPTASLHVAGTEQEGVRYYSAWTARGRGGCSTGTAEGPARFPRPERVPPGAHDLTFVLATVRRPLHVRLTAWRAWSEASGPVGPAEELPVSVGRVDEGSGPRYVTVRARTTLAGDHYLRLLAEWRDGEGCGIRQGAAWGFRLAAP